MRRELRNWLCSLQGTATRHTPGALRVWPCSQRTAPSSTGALLRAAPTTPPLILCRPLASRSRPRERAPSQRYAWLLAPELGTCFTLKGHAKTCATWHSASRLDLRLAKIAYILASPRAWGTPAPIANSRLPALHPQQRVLSDFALTNYPVGLPVYLPPGSSPEDQASAVPRACV